MQHLANTFETRPARKADGPVSHRYQHRHHDAGQRRPGQAERPQATQRQADGYGQRHQIRQHTGDELRLEVHLSPEPGHVDSAERDQQKIESLHPHHIGHHLGAVEIADQAGTAKHQHAHGPRGADVHRKRCTDILRDQLPGLDEVFGNAEITEVGGQRGKYRGHGVHAHLGRRQDARQHHGGHQLQRDADVALRGRIGQGQAQLGHSGSSPR